MNGLVIILIGIVALAAGYLLYGGWLAKKWGIDPNAKTPAYTHEDGQDYVPSSRFTVFSHQFSSIAGAGPVTGPILASVFGWVPVLLWLIIGGLFFGAVQDFGALYASVKNEGKSIGMVIEKYIGKTGRRLFMLFCWLFTLLVIAAFTDMVAGTFVGVGRKLAGLDIPLLGINFGQVGFLTELSAVGWEPALERLLAGKMITRTCLLLAWELLRGGTPIASGHAANDVVVGRGAIARVLPVHVFVDGEDMGVVRSDGVIVSTPLGSSAYALSAHGPLVHPKVQALTLTPISPFFKSFPPIVLPADSRIRLETDAAAPDAFLTVDGQEGIPLCGGDVIRVQSLDAGLRVLSCSSGTYFQRLRERGFIQTDGTSAPEHV